MEGLESVVGIAFEFFHFCDSLQLAQVSAKLNRLISARLAGEKVLSKLVVHGLDSSDHVLDLRFSEFLVCAPPDVKNGLVERFAGATDIVAHNYDESRHFLETSIFPKAKAPKIIELHNVVDLASLSAIPHEHVTKLSLGLNLFETASESVSRLELPNLTILEIRGFPFYDSAAVSWLLTLLASANRLKTLSINCPMPLSNECRFAAPPFSSTPPSWNSASLFFLDIQSSSEHSTSRQQREQFAKFVDFVFFRSVGGFPRLNTVTLNASPSALMWQSLAACTSLLHMVVSNIWQLDLKTLAGMIQNNVLHIQILVLKFAGKTNLHIDSVIQAIMNAGSSLPRTRSVAPPLERLELEVVMDETSCVMDAPYMTLKAATTLRCRYRDNMFFKRTKFGIQMSLDREMCSFAPADLSVASPMELFAEEMIRHTFDDPTSPQIEAEMINEWNSIGQIQRNMYVEIYDDFVDRELREFEDPASLYDGSNQSKVANDGGYCDVSATIANLRE